MKKQIIGIVRDHSMSMNRLAKYALLDYNMTLKEIKDSSSKHAIDTFVSVVECGMQRQDSWYRDWSNYKISNLINCREFFVPINNIQPLEYYETPGGSTPLYDSVGILIDRLQVRSQYDDSSLLILVTTDGEENSSVNWSSKTLSNQIRMLQDTGKWTFVFRVPKGYKQSITSKLGLYDDNVIEWELSPQGMERVSDVTTRSFGNYYNLVASGATASRSFYTPNMNVSKENIQSNMIDVSALSKVYYVSNDTPVRDFILSKGHSWTTGCTYYQLMKSEDVQVHKNILVRSKNDGRIFTGLGVRKMLGLPDGTFKVHPGISKEYDIFIQSTSVNRKLLKNTTVIFYNS